MDYSKIIVIDPARRSGKPCIRDTRITVYDVLDYLASGMSETDILHDFPELVLADIRASLAFAADRERRSLVLQQFTQTIFFDPLLISSRESPKHIP
jgi:uncharacterized protein (DUF433 family)